MISRVYRNDSETEYQIPGLGWVGPGQRVTFHGEFPPPINLENYPGLVDVEAEEASGIFHDYNENPEPEYTEPVEAPQFAVKNPSDENVASAPVGEVSVQPPKEGPTNG